MKKYGLYHKNKKRLLGVDTCSNSDGDFCVNVQYELSVFSHNLWLVDTFEKAEFVRNNNTEWYNADYETPTNQYRPNELKVVKVELNYES